MAKNYYSDENMAKIRAALAAACDEVRTGTVTRVSISNGNVKMGQIPSVSLLPFVTCPACAGGTCGASCYAAKIALLRPSVMRAYARNTALAMYKPALFWRQVRAAVNMSRYFRFHVSGDFMSRQYFEEVIKTAQECPGTEILAFTKRYSFINDWIRENGDLPKNLHILFSGWSNLDPVNPYAMPETNVIMPGADVPDSWRICGGNCYECVCRGLGCWQAQKGDVVAFHLH